MITTSTFNKIVGHWTVPLYCLALWWGMLSVMLVYWTIQGKVDFKKGSSGPVIAVYLSTIASGKMKPVFVLTAFMMGAIVTCSVWLERFRLHRGRLERGRQWVEQINSYGVVGFSVVAYASLLLVAVLDCKRYYHIHIALLVVFLTAAGIATYWTIAEYTLLDANYRRFHRLRISYACKFIWVTTELVLVIPFSVLSLVEMRIPGAIFEWIIAYLYGFYLLIMALDHYPDFESIENQVLEMEVSESLDKAVSAAFQWYRPMLAKNTIGDFEAMEYEISSSMGSNSSNTDMTKVTDTVDIGCNYEPKCRTTSFTRVSAIG